MSDQSSLLNRIFGGRLSDMAVSFALIMIVFMLIIPLPAVILDLLMAGNLMLSLLILMLVINVKEALDFTTFPSMLLVSTLFGLGLNVSSTRLILSKGAEFDGKIVRAFATFVVGTSGSESLVIGIIIFIILVAVQVVVITKGATRVSEVAARFTLDGLPTKQMSIDQELSSGYINDEQARIKKQNLQRESDFYGAMDGASKFVSGNVKVGILITVVNIVGGMIVGMTIHNESAGLAASTYTSLTIGDGLVSQIPALLISFATGMIVTRSVSEDTFGKQVTSQFTQDGRLYWVVAVFLLIMGVLPGFPVFIFLPLGFFIGFMAWRLSSTQARDAARTKEGTEEKKQAPAEISPIVPLDPLSLELGYELISLVDKEHGAELLDRITRIRKEQALELGLVIPHIRIIDNMRLSPTEYCFKIRGSEAGRGEIRKGHYMAINPGGEREDLPGEKTTEPAFGLPALWISEDFRAKAERAGYTVVDAPSIVATHLTEIIKNNSGEILGRQDVKSMMDALREDYPSVVDDTMKSLDLGKIQQILQNLLNEQVSIRNIITILETLANYSGITTDLDFLTDKVRQSLARQISGMYADPGKTLHVITIEPALEQHIIESRMDNNPLTGAVAVLDPEMHRKWSNALMNSVQQVQTQGIFPCIICSEASRKLVRSLTEKELPKVPVLSTLEIAKEFSVERSGQISLNQERI